MHVCIAFTIRLCQYGILSAKVAEKLHEDVYAIMHSVSLCDIYMYSKMCLPTSVSVSWCVYYNIQGVLIIVVPIMYETMKLNTSFD